MSNKTCQICDYKWTERKRKKIICDNCKEECCLECYTNYILTSTDNNKCMFCNIEKKDSTIISDLGGNKTTINKFFISKSEIFINNEKKNIPKYLEYNNMQENIKKKRKIYQEEMDIIERKIKTLQMLAIATRKQKLIDDENDEKNLLKIKHEDYYKLFSKYKCFNHTCNGFLNIDFYCILCKTQYCKKCNKLKPDDHVCAEEDLQTVNYIQEHTAACPNCGERISKASGCDQMFCDPKDGGIGCGAVFSYRTGKIVENNGHIHNPHYLERRKKFKPEQPGLDIFSFTIVQDWSITFNSYSVLNALDLRLFFIETWNARDKLVKRKKKYFSEVSFKEEIFTIGINFSHNEEEWKKNIKNLIKKSYNFPKLEELWQQLIEHFEDKIYRLIDMFNKKEITREKLYDFFQILASECSATNSKIDVLSKKEGIKILKKYYINYVHDAYRYINYVRIM